MTGVAIDTSTLADRVGACAVALAPLVEAIRRHVLAAERLHADDTTVPVLAKGKTATGRLWTYVRDDRPFGGADPPAAAFHYSRSRSGEYPREHMAAYSGIMQADAFAGFNDDPQAWLADVLARLPDHPTKRIDELLPWAWKASRDSATLAQAA